MRRLLCGAIPLLLVFSVSLAVAQTGSEWDRILEAAKREGKVAVTSPGGPEMREVLTQPFQRKYGIPVEHFGAAGRELSPRVMNERKAGQFLWDVFLHGTTTALTVMIPAKAFDPLEPALLPEIKEPKNWRNGALEFMDPEQMNLVMTPMHRGTLFVNPTLVKPEELKSYKDLLDPKWKGKLVVDDPRNAGPGQATFIFLYQHPQLGPAFIQALAKQDLVILRDFRQQADLVAQGKYPVLVGGYDVIVEALIKQGAPLAIVSARQLREGTDLNPVNGSLALYSKAPHPNAAKVYVNWLLSREGQTEFARAMGYVSARLDVPTDHVASWRVPQPGPAIKTYTAEAMVVKDKLIALLKDALGR